MELEYINSSLISYKNIDYQSWPSLIMYRASHKKLPTFKLKYFWKYCAWKLSIDVLECWTKAYLTIK